MTCQGKSMIHRRKETHRGFSMNHSIGRCPTVKWLPFGPLAGPWSDLTSVLVEQIAERLSHVDLLHFSAVCKSWRSVVKENYSRLPFQLPMCHCLSGDLPLPLLLMSYNKEGTDSAEFLCLSNGKVYGEFVLPELRNKRITGSSEGWLVTIGIQDRKVHLLNPLTKSQILVAPDLPRPVSHCVYGTIAGYPRDYTYRFVYKTILSSDPNISGDNCIVMAIVSHCRKLCFSRVGDHSWIKISDSWILIDDVINHKGKFYATDTYGHVFSIESIGPVGERTLIAPKPKEPEQEDYLSRKYLVESSGGELLLVNRRAQYMTVDQIGTDLKTIGFDVFKLELEDANEDHPTYMWVKSERIGEEMIFLGNGCSLCFPSNLYPRCKGNCIYFSDDDFTHQLYSLNFKLRKEKSIRENPDVEDCGESIFAVYHDNGIYDMVDGRILPLDPDDPCIFAEPPVWLTPKPW